MNRILSVFFLFLYLIIGFTPYLGSIDKVATQFLVLSILNPIITLFIIINKDSLNEGLNNLLENLYFYLYSFFILISFSTIFIAVNDQEVIIETSKSLIYFIAFCNIYVLLFSFEKNLKYIPILLGVILIIENYLVLEEFINGFDLNDKNRNTNLRAFTGNINITAFTMLYKLPFLLYTLNFSKNLLLRFFIFLLACLTVFLILSFGSRAANLTIFTYLIIIISFCLKWRKERKVINNQILSFMAILVPVITNIFLYTNNDSINFIERTSKLNNASSNQRIRFYEDAIQSTIENPILGIGRGNWKLESIKRDKLNITDYTVPYHAHNDFLEILAETGILGMITHYSIFIIVLFLILKIIFFKNKPKFDLIFISPFLLSILGFLVDSLLNFPLARPVSFIPILFLIAVLIRKEFKSINLFSLNILSKNSGVIIFYCSLILSLIIIPLKYSTYIAYTNEGFLMAAGRGAFKDFTKDDIFSISSDYPNLSGASVPIEAMKVNALVNKEIFLDTMLYMLKKSDNQNPYLGYSDVLTSLYYLNEVNFDSAYKYSKLAFYKIPDHNTHFELLMDIIEFKKDSTELEKAYNFIKKPLRSQLENKYLQTALKIKDSFNLSEKNIIKKLKNRDKKAFNIFNTILNVGKKNVQTAYLKSLEAEKLFSSKEYIKAGDKFLEASKLNPEEKSYIENAGNSYMQGGNDRMSIQILEDFIEKYNPNTGKAENLIAISYLSIGDNKNACLYFEKAKEKSFSVNPAIINRFCN